MIRDARLDGRDDVVAELLAELDIDFAPPRTDGYWGIKRTRARRSLRGFLERQRRQRRAAGYTDDIVASLAYVYRHIYSDLPARIAGTSHPLNMLKRSARVIAVDPSSGTITVGNPRFEILRKQLYARAVAA